MITSNFKIALRNLTKNRAYTAIIVFGLSVGLACSIVMVLYVIGELSYDTQRSDSRQIYRIISSWKSPTAEGWRTGASAPVGRALQKERPEVERIARVVPPYENDNNVLIEKNTDRFFEKKIFFVDPEIVEIFPLRFLTGDVSSALTRMNTVVITEGMARKYFGDENPLGQMIKMEFDYDLGNENVRLEEFEVTGILADSPHDSHFQYHMLVSMATLRKNRTDFEDNWLDYHGKYCYIKLREGVDPRDIEHHLGSYIRLEEDLFEQRYKRSLNQTRTYILQPIRDIHLHNLKMEEREPKGSWLYIQIYSLIAGLVLLIGCMNFINLSTALSTTRIKEVGLKKVIGAAQAQLIRQFLSESFLITFLAYLLALGITAFLLPFFNDMAQTQLSLGQIVHPVVLPALLLIFIIVGTISGWYPAFILARCNPVRILQGRFSLRQKSSFLHNVLVIGQFSISIFLLLTTIFAFKQLSYMKGQSLGFNKEQKLVLRVNSNLNHLRRDYDAIVDAFKQSPDITGAAISSGVPGGNFSGGYGMWREGADRNGSKFIHCLTITPGFLELYGIQLAYGQAFQNGSVSDCEEAFIINIEAAKELGFETPGQAVGQRFTAHYNGKTKTIIGVTEDFHVRGMQEKIIPLVMDIEASLFNTITLGLSAGKIPMAMGFVKEKWQEHFPNVPMDFGFLDEEFDRVYRYEEQMGRMLALITALGMVVACLGLMGLAAFVTWKKSKEIGIRKVLGASSGHIVQLISNRLLMLVLVALAIACPLSWLAVTRWLDGFAYRISLDVSVFFLVAAGMMVMAFLTVFLQTLRALHLSPVLSLKEE